MPKAGTGWLFNQLQYHPDFWMPPTKEFDYLKRDVPRLKNAVARLGRAKERFQADDEGGRIKWGNRRDGDERDLAFLEEASAHAGQPMDLGRYASLFRFKGELLSGDISPSYITLRDDVITRVGEELPETKVILLVRDPISRTASQLSMAYRLGKLDIALTEDPDRLRSFLEKSATTNQRSFPTEIVSRWKQCAPKIDFKWFLFDDIEDQPEQARNDILTHLGADPEKKSGDLAFDENKKSGKEKIALSDDAVAILIEHFTGELRAGAKLFESHAQEWVTRYGL